jgi:hypothetical protein
MISATRGSMARVLSGGDVLPCPARQGRYLRRRRVLRRMRLRRRAVQRWGQQRNGSRPAGAQTGTLGEEGPQFEKRTAARGRYFRIDLPSAWANDQAATRTARPICSAVRVDACPALPCLRGCCPA